MSVRVIELEKSIEFGTLEVAGRHELAHVDLDLACPSVGELCVARVLQEGLRWQVGEQVRLEPTAQQRVQNQNVLEGDDDHPL